MDTSSPLPQGASDSCGDETDGASNVTNHYNKITEKGLDVRNQSKIVYLRNFNNWIKSMLIEEFIIKIKEKQKNSKGRSSRTEEIRVVDLCCGKGGDLFKWKKSEVSHVVCTDIASQSVTDAAKRYDGMKSKVESNQKLFTAEFIVADVTKTLIRTQFKDPNMMFDLVSCQFALHYSFESLPQAETLLRNVSESLKMGGYFIGTIPNAYDIVGRKQAAKANWFGNTVFTITFEDTLPEPYPLFGARYNFHLHEAVDCPEYLVHFPTFTRLAERFGLKLVKKSRFQNYYDEKKKIGQSLLYVMNALETYPAQRGAPLLGPRSDYAHAKKYFEEFPGNKLIGTLSKSEWEVCTIYMVFAFEKVGSTPPLPAENQV